MDSTITVSGSGLVQANAMSTDGGSSIAFLVEPAASEPYVRLNINGSFIVIGEDRKRLARFLRAFADAI